MNIRSATSLDRDAVNDVHVCAFPKGERGIVSALAVNLLLGNTTPQTISLVAESGGEVVGHVAFSPVTIDNNTRLQGYILAPLGVKPDYQKRRIGTKLIEAGMQQLLKMGVNILFVYGDPAYYSKFGFSADLACRFTPPYRLRYPFGWQAIILNACHIEGSSIQIACVTSLCHTELW